MGGRIVAVELIDGKRGQERVETGLGWIAKLADPEGKRNAAIEFRADHLQQPIKAWIDTQGPLYPPACDAFSTGRRIQYRIAVRRKASVDNAKTIAELTNTQKVRELDGLAFVENLAPNHQGQPVPGSAPAGPGQNATTAQMAGKDGPQRTSGGVDTLPRPDGPPPEGRFPCVDCNAFAFETAAELRAHWEGNHRPGVQPQPAPTPPLQQQVSEHLAANQPADPPASTAQQEGQARQAEQAARLQAEREERMAATTFDPDANPMDMKISPAPRGAKVVEEKPWVAYNSDGTLNTGSYAMGACTDFVKLAHKLVCFRIRDVQAETGEAPEMHMGQAKALARSLLAAADRAQAANRADGRTDRMDGSHRRAREAVQEALWLYPVPWGASAEQREAWLEQLTAHATVLVRIALDLFRESET